MNGASRYCAYCQQFQGLPNLPSGRSEPAFLPAPSSFTILGGKKLSEDSGVEDFPNAVSPTPKGLSSSSIDPPRLSPHTSHSHSSSLGTPDSYCPVHDSGRIQSFPFPCWKCRVPTEPASPDPSSFVASGSFNSLCGGYYPSLDYPPPPPSYHHGDRSSHHAQSLPPIGSFPEGNQDLLFSSTNQRPDFISLPESLENQVRSIAIGSNTGVTPLDAYQEASSAQHVIHDLNNKVLTPNPVDQKYLEIRDYMSMGEIGRGGQGTCFYAMDRIKERMFAYKMTNNEDDKLKLLRESEILSELQHQHVIVFLGAVDEVEEGKVRMFMELAECGTIEQVFRESPALQVDTMFVAHLLEQVMQGVNYLHQKCILHRDIKGNNILLFEDSRCKLADFGLAVHADDVSKDNCVKGTGPYVSPEYVQTQVFSYSCDVWSTMAVAVEMLTGTSPWHPLSNAALMFKIGNYKASTHFHELVPEQHLEQRLREVCTQQKDFIPNMFFFRGIMAMMKNVFQENTSCRPSAYDLLRTEVMRKAADVYEYTPSDSEFRDLLNSAYPDFEESCDVVSRGPSRGSLAREERESAGSHRVPFKTHHSWPMNCSEYRDHLDNGRRYSMLAYHPGSPKSSAVFKRAHSYQHYMEPPRQPLEQKTLMRRHSLAETYMMRGPESD